MKALFKTFPALLKQFGETDEVREALVFAAWRQTAGELLAAHTEPVCLEAQRLVIAVSDKTWKRHLEDLSGQMLFKLNSALGSQTVTFIEFRINEKKVMENRTKREKAPFPETDALKEITQELHRSADVIRTDSLRHEFLLAAGYCLARKKTLKDRMD